MQRKVTNGNMLEVLVTNVFNIYKYIFNTDKFGVNHALSFNLKLVENNKIFPKS